MSISDGSQASNLLAERSSHVLSELSWRTSAGPQRRKGSKLQSFPPEFSRRPYNGSYSSCASISMSPLASASPTDADDV